MSSAHRPTWTPAMGKDARLNTKQYSSRDIAGHTKLKYRQAGQNTPGEISRRDLKLELQLAEREAAIKKRKQAGLLPLTEESETSSSSHHQRSIELGNQEDEQSSRLKRVKLLEQALLDDKDDSDSEDEADADQCKKQKKNQKGKGVSTNEAGPEALNHASENGHPQANGGGNDDDDDDDDDDDSDDDESETVELMKELEKVRRERAEEKERQERESATATALDREAEAAAGNPLLNLKAALNQNGNTSPTNSVATSTPSFSVRRRWDDDVIFKNQARDVNEKPKKEFVNDLLRTEFHHRFLKKFIA